MINRLCYCFNQSTLLLFLTETHSLVFYHCQLCPWLSIQTIPLTLCSTISSGAFTHAFLFMHYSYQSSFTNLCISNYLNGNLSVCGQLDEKIAENRSHIAVKYVE